MKKLLFTVTIIAAGTFLASGLKAQSELQVIHNCSDPAAAVVDIYVDGSLAVDDFNYRTATPFLNLPSGVPINIGVAPGTSNSANDTLVNFTVSLAANERYVALASGVLNPGQFAMNPDMVSTAFGLQITAGVELTSQNANNVDLIINHGSTDAPTVDVVARNVATILDDAKYSDISNYVSVPASSYILDITPGNDNSTIVASFEADLSGLAGSTAIVFASGFLDPSQNQNGPAFGLFAALPNGTVVTLPGTSIAELQVIHNAADPAAALVDIYLDGVLAIDDFAFRSATPFIEVPADGPVNIGVAGSSSSSVNDTLVNFTAQFNNGSTYIAVANGVLNPGSFAVNPDGASTAFTLFVQDDIRKEASNTSEVDFVVVHGSTDAPTVDVLVSGGGPLLVDDASYSDITPYISVPPSIYTLNVTPGNDNSIIVASFIADLSGLAGGSAVVFASGFLDPSNNQNGEAFGLFAALANGTVVPFQLSTGIFEAEDQIEVTVYPNPVDNSGQINISTTEENVVNVAVTTIDGKIVDTFQINPGSKNTIYEIDELSRGLYFLNATSVKGSSTMKLVVR